MLRVIKDRLDCWLCGWWHDRGQDPPPHDCPDSQKKKKEEE